MLLISKKRASEDIEKTVKQMALDLAEMLGYYENDTSYITKQLIKHAIQALETVTLSLRRN